MRQPSKDQRDTFLSLRCEWVMKRDEEGAREVTRR